MKSDLLSILDKLKCCLDDLKTFCPTGPGGGVDPSCGGGGSGSGGSGSGGSGSEPWRGDPKWEAEVLAGRALKENGIPHGIITKPERVTPTTIASAKKSIDSMPKLGYKIVQGEGTKKEIYEHPDGHLFISSYGQNKFGAGHTYRSHLKPTWDRTGDDF